MPKIITREVTEEFKSWPYGLETKPYVYIHKEIIKRKYTKRKYTSKHGAIPKCKSKLTQATFAALLSGLGGSAKKTSQPTGSGSAKSATQGL